MRKQRMQEKKEKNLDGYYWVGKKFIWVFCNILWKNLNRGPMGGALEGSDKYHWRSK